MLSPSDVLNEESGEILNRATPVIDTTFYKPPDITEILDTTVFIDPSNPFSDKIQSKLLKKVTLLSLDSVLLLSSF